MVNQATHPWKLTGPWYRGDSVGGVMGGRNSVPIIQKYAASDFANRIVREPQQSLKFVSEDFVERLTSDPNQVITLPIRKKNHERLKLFLDLHSRFYIVVCSLQCDVAGFPKVSREQVCEAGFVVRRHKLQLSAQAKKPFGKIMRERSEIKSQVLKTLESANRHTSNPVTFVDALFNQTQEFVGKVKSGQLQKLRQGFDKNTQALESLIDKHQIKRELHGWKPVDIKGVGNWEAVGDAPQILDEQVYPLYPIVADPTDSEHSAKGQTLWFGVVPTSSGDSTSDGDVKFHDDIAYHVRCFVRRHKPQCYKKNNETDCSGELVWSEPTESYQLASAYDLDGASHRPINITMPNLGALRKQVDLGPAGRGVSAKVVSPENSTPVFSTKMMDLPEPGNPTTRSNDQICFYFPFLFFLVAMFLFRLILPIFMFIFQLWFLLKLKFCILPSFEMSLDLQAELEAEFSLEIEAEFSVDMAAELAIKGPDFEAKFAADSNFSVDIGGVSFTNANQGVLQSLIAKMISEETGVSGEEGTEGDSLKARIENDISQLSLNELAETFITLKTQYQDVTHSELAGDLPTPEQGLHYFEKVYAK